MVGKLPTSDKGTLHPKNRRGAGVLSPPRSCRRCAEMPGREPTSTAAPPRSLSESEYGVRTNLAASGADGRLRSASSASLSPASPGRPRPGQEAIPTPWFFPPQPLERVLPASFISLETPTNGVSRARHRLGSDSGPPVVRHLRERGRSRERACPPRDRGGIRSMLLPPGRFRRCRAIPHRRRNVEDEGDEPCSMPPTRSR